MARRTNSAPDWREVLSDESLARIVLDPVVGPKGLSGYIPVFPAADARGNKIEVKWISPQLCVVAGGATFMHGAIYKNVKDEFARWITVKTAQDYAKNQGWLERHPDVEQDNEEYYERVEAYLARIRDLVWELEATRSRFIKEVIGDLPEEVLDVELMKLEEKRNRETVGLLLTKKKLLEATANKLELDKNDRGWRKTAAAHLAKQKSVIKEPAFLSELKDKMRINYKDTVLTKMNSDPTYAEDKKILKTARGKFDSAFRSWVFNGKEADGEGGEEMIADDPPHGIHRLKMRPFIMPRKPRSDSSGRGRVDFSKPYTQVPVRSFVAEKAGLDAREVFLLEQRARDSGHIVNRMNIRGAFTSKKMNRLPDGSKIPWHDDPRQEMLRPGSVASFDVSFFIYVEPRMGIRMHFGPDVRLFERGPKYGRVLAEMDMSQAIAIDDDENDDEDEDGEGGEGGEGGRDQGPPALPSVSSRKMLKGRVEEMDDDDDDDDDESPQLVRKKSKVDSAHPTRKTKRPDDDDDDDDDESPQLVRKKKKKSRVDPDDEIEGGASTEF